MPLDNGFSEIIFQNFPQKKYIQTRECPECFFFEFLNSKGEWEYYLTDKRKEWLDYHKKTHGKIPRCRNWQKDFDAQQ